MENWKDVPGYDGRYQVSDIGRVQSWRWQRWTVLKGEVTDAGYQRYRLLGRWKRAHALVLTTFIGPAPTGTEGCHRNGNPLDNRVSNLYWGTKSQNAFDTVRHGRNVNASKTQCPDGHDYTPANTYVLKTKSGTGRGCRICRAAAKRRLPLGE